MNQSFMKEKAILPLVLSMSIPNVLSMLINSLYNIVDSLFVAKINEDAMTALSLVYPIQNISLAIGVGFSVGVNAVIALYLGMQENKKANQAASTGLFLSAVHGVLLTLLCMKIMPHFLSMFTSSSQILTMGTEYASIVFLFCVPHHVYIGMEKIFQAVGRMKTSMFAMMAGCIANIILDPILIFGAGPIPAMGIAGAAWATGIGQLLSMMIYVTVYFINPISVKLRKKYFCFSKSISGKIYSIGIPASLSMALPSLLISALNSILATFSQVYLVVLGSYYKLQTFVYMPANGIIQGIRPLMGYNYGAKEYHRTKKIYHVSLIFCSGMMLIGSLLCFLLPSHLMQLFTNNPETITAGTQALPIIAIGFLPSAVSITSSGALEGLGKGLHSLYIALLRYVILIIPLAFFLSRALNAIGVWHAFWITEFITAGISYLLYKKAFPSTDRHL